MPQNNHTNTHATLGQLLQAHDELRYALIATPQGEILCEVGSRAALTYPTFADYVAEADTLRFFYERVLEVEQLNDRRFIPQGYAQGNCQALYGRTGAGELLVAVGLMPPDVLAGSAEMRAHWLYGLQQRIWKTVGSLFTAAA